MELIDSHCHIHDKSVYQYVLSRHPKASPTDFTPEKILQRSIESGVKKLICVGTNHADSLIAQDFAKDHKEVFWSYGIHPEEHTTEKDLKTPWLDKTPPVAIGEVGLDYHHTDQNRSAQINLLEEMLDLATRLDLPVIFHVREAFDDFFPVVSNFRIKHAVVHSFSDSPENLQKCLDQGFFIGVNGMTTFINLPLPPLEQMLLETDAPFLTPVPFRDKINEPMYVANVAKYIANKTGVPLDQVAERTSKNAEKLFRF